MSEEENSKDISYVQLHLDNKTFGAGVRWLIKFNEGRKLVSLCEPPTATVVRVSRFDLRVIKVHPAPRWRRLTRTLSNRIRANKRWGIPTVRAARELAVAMRKMT